MRVLMTCGGTGGHINPAIAIANTIKNNIPDAEILFVGTKKGKERELVPREGYELKFVESEGIRRSLSPANIKAVIRAVISPYLAKSVIREFAPDVVIGTGGYACWPILKAASMMKIPTVVHESNAIPGLAVKRLQKNVSLVMTNFERTAEYLSPKAKVMRVGNPLRSAFVPMDKKAAKAKLGIPEDAVFVLSYGGSGGAEYVNETVVQMLGKYIADRNDIFYSHAAGSRDYSSTNERFCGYGLDKLKNVKLYEYIYDMPIQMAAADIIICRAGAMTVSELSMMKKASIMIPSPNVVDNHQYKNAKVLADAEAVVLLEEANMTPDTLWENIDGLIKNPERRSLLETNIEKFADVDANKVILNEIIRVAKTAK